MGKKTRITSNSAIRVKGTTEELEVDMGELKNLENLRAVQQANRKFIHSPENIITKPVLGQNILPRHLVNELKTYDVQIKYSNYSLKSPVATIKRSSVSKDTLNEMGIIPEVVGGQYILSLYDLLHLTFEGEILPRQSYAMNVHKELYEYITKLNPQFSENYLIYQKMKGLGFAIQDGMFANTELDFLFYDEPNEAIIGEMLKLDKSLVGNKTRKRSRREVSPYAVGGIMVVTPGMDMMQVIRNQHISDKADFKFYLAEIDAPRDRHNRILENGALKLYAVRKNKKNEQQTSGKDAIIISDPKYQIERIGV